MQKSNGVASSAGKVHRVCSRKISTPSAKSEGGTHVCSEDNNSSNNNKVTVFVPYSTIVRCMNETLERKNQQIQQQKNPGNTAIIINLCHTFFWIRPFYLLAMQIYRSMRNTTFTTSICIHTTLASAYFNVLRWEIFQTLEKST